MGCGASLSTSAGDDDDTRVYCRRPGGVEIRPGVELSDGRVQDWEFSPLQVTVPPGGAAGTVIPVTTADGMELEVVCPADLTVGDTFQCLYYTSADELVNSVGTDWHARKYANNDADNSSNRVPLHLCNSCGFGPASMNCFKCGARSTVGTCIAPACKDCVYGSKSKECAKCGTYFGDAPKHTAVLCRSCGFGPDGQDRCAKCGAHCGAFRK